MAPPFPLAFNGVPVGNLSSPPEPRDTSHVRALLERNAHYSTVACASAEAMRSVKAKGGDMRFFGLAVNLVRRADGVLESISFTNSIQ